MYLHLKSELQEGTTADADQMQLECRMWQPHRREENFPCTTLSQPAETKPGKKNSAILQMTSPIPQDAGGPEMSRLERRIAAR
jgi:hypothetical protein